MDVFRLAGTPVMCVRAAEDSARILLTEDDVLVSEARVMLLEEFGYSVTWPCAGPAVPEAGVRSDAARYPHLPVLLSSRYSSAAAEAVANGIALLPSPCPQAPLQRAIAATQGHSRPTGTRLT
jgi:hypothetical protein